MTVSGSTPGTTTDQMRCFCCGHLFAASEIIRFGQHPEEGVCERCAAWLHNHGRPEHGERAVWRRHGRGRWRRDR